MILKELILENFRLHKNNHIKFSDRLNYITGGNGQGKTSILEAAYYLCTTKSFNASNDFDPISFGERKYKLSGKFTDLTDNMLSISYDIDLNKKLFFENQKPITRFASIIGKYPVVVLTPSDISITKGSPSDRRKFVDSVISQSSNTYLNFLLEYNRILKQRSALLNDIREKKYMAVDIHLESWNIRLIEVGSEIINHRISFINDFKEFLKKSYSAITSINEIPSVDYIYLKDYKYHDIKDEFTRQINARLNDEIIRGMNLVGPHRDEFIFKINDFELKKFGSTGQHKTFQVALRFAEFFYLKEFNKRIPIFLMDDVFSELDTERAERISKTLSEFGQAFITMTDFTQNSTLMKTENDLLINVENGKIFYA